MKKLFTILLCLVLLFTAMLSMVSCNSTKYTVGICQLAPHVALDSASEGFMQAIKDQLGEENVTFLYQNAQGDPNTCSTIINDFTTKNVDLILANATAALSTAANATTTIPVLGTSITDYASALELSDFAGVVGGNVSGTSDLPPLDQQAAMIKELFPEAKNVGFVYCSAEANSLFQIEKMEEYLAELGFTTQRFSFSDSTDISSVSASAAASSDVIYVPTDNTVANFAATVLGAIGDTPLIAGEENICRGCGVATLSIDYYDLGYKTGLMAAEILSGTADISTMEIKYADASTKKYSKTRCDELGIDTEALEALGYIVIEE